MLERPLSEHSLVLFLTVVLLVSSRAVIVSWLGCPSRKLGCVVPGPTPDASSCCEYSMEGTIYEEYHCLGPANSLHEPQVGCCGSQRDLQSCAQQHILRGIVPLVQ